MEPLTPRSAAHVYRVYSDDRLIYIGCSQQLFQRLDQHRAGSWWASSATRVHASTFPDVAEAQLSEKAAIFVERPRWNRYERRWRLLTTLAPNELDDYATATLNDAWFQPSRRAGRSQGHQTCCESPGLLSGRTLAALRGEAARRFDSDLDLSEHDRFVAAGYRPLAPWPPLHLRVPAGAA